MSDLTLFPADIAEMSVNQLAALPPAPPCGLCLWRVSYAATPAEDTTCS